MSSVEIKVYTPDQSVTVERENRFEPADLNALLDEACKSIRAACNLEQPKPATLEPSEVLPLVRQIQHLSQDIFEGSSKMQDSEIAEEIWRMADILRQQLVIE